MEEHCFSERAVCRLLKFSRSTYRYKSKNSNQAIIEKLEDLALKNPRFGSPRLAALLRRQGVVINHKKAARLCKVAGLTLKRRRKKRFKIQRAFVPAIKADKPMTIWGMDFVHHRCASGEKFKCLTIVDHSSKVCHGMLVQKRILSEDVISFLENIKLDKGLPKNFNLDNGSEFTSLAFTSWCDQNRINIRFIQPGKPVENAFIESFNGRFRDECLSLSAFADLRHAAFEIERWRNYYNHERPHSSLNYRSPIEAAVPNYLPDHQ